MGETAVRKTNNLPMILSTFRELGHITGTVVVDLRHGQSRANIHLGTSSSMEATETPRHSLFIGAEGRLVLHLVQLVYFMLLQRESRTMDRKVGKAQA